MTGRSCPLRVATSCREARSQMVISPSSAPTASRRPSGEKEQPKNRVDRGLIRISSRCELKSQTRTSVLTETSVRPSGDSTKPSTSLVCPRSVTSLA